MLELLFFLPLPLPLPPQGTPPQANQVRPVARLGRLPKERLIQWDGRVGAPEWEGAGSLGDLTEVRPVEGAAPSTKTEVLLFQDGQALWIGIVAHDEPALVRARQMDRDAFVEFDDVVELWLDTFGTAQNAYWFQITAAGSIGDALISDGGQRFNKSWDTIWDGRAALTERGWEAEIRIPLQSLAFDSSRQDFGMNLRRRRVHNDEDSRWASPLLSTQFFQLSAGGLLLGTEGLEQGAGLTLLPYLRGDLRRPAGEGSDAGLDLGGDLLWRPTPASSLQLTLRTDFAETEVDDLRVNLTRFPLFFPEKRDFFLEDAALFEFGAPSNKDSLVPFFSRTVGRDGDGHALGIDAGLKGTLREGPFSLAGLAVHTAPWSDGSVDSKDLTVLRATRQIGESGALGLLLTEGLPDAKGQARTAGVDLRLQRRDLFTPGDTASFWAFGLWSDNNPSTGLAHSGHALGIEADLLTREWNVSLAANEISGGFDPALGFLSRAGIRTLMPRARWRRQLGREGRLRSVSSELEVDWTEDLVGGEDRLAIEAEALEVEFQTGDKIGIEFEPVRETIENSFELAPGASVQPGDYSMLFQRLVLETNTRRSFKLEGELELGDFYGGEVVRTTLEPLWIPSRYGRVGLSYTSVQGGLESGPFELETWQLELGLSFNPRLSLGNLLQYDRGAKELGFQSRLRWILNPGQDFFVVGQGGWLRDTDRSWQREDLGLVLKLVWAVRF